MLIINAAWESSFVRVEQNRKATSERGWHPYNCNLLTYPTLRETMTDEDKQDELNSNAITLPLPSSCTTLVVSDSTLTPTFDPSFLRITDGQEHTPLNYSQGMTACCLDAMVSENDIKEARQRNQQNKNKGKSLKEKVEGWRKVIGGKLFAAGECRLGKSVFERVKANKTTQTRKDKATREKASAAYVELVNKLEEVKAMMIAKNK